MLNIVCVNCGTKYGNSYVDRLYLMTKRFLDIPFTFTCFTDQPINTTHPIIQIDCSSWGVNGWFTKLKLFDGHTIPYDSMLFMDVSLIIKAPLRQLIEFVLNQHKDFIVLHDWHYDCINSCVMWIKKGDITQTIWDMYASGMKYQTILQGDQDYINAVIKDKCLEKHIAYFPQEYIASYKDLLRTHRMAQEGAISMLEEAIIVKFHGHPKPHELLNPWLRFRHLTLRYPSHAVHDWSFLTKEIQEWWQ